MNPARAASHPATEAAAAAPSSGSHGGHGGHGVHVGHVGHGAHPAPPRDAEAQAALDAELVALMEQRITFNQVLGLRVSSLRPMTLGLAMRPQLVGHYHYGRLHGGVISALLDTLGGGAVMVAIVDRHPADTVEQAMHRFLKLGTIDLRVDYLRPGLGEHFVAQAEVTRLGGRVASAQMRLHNDQGTLIATGSAAYIVS